MPKAGYQQSEKQKLQLRLARNLEELKRDREKVRARLDLIADLEWQLEVIEHDEEMDRMVGL